jgi:arabinogalactan oligomer/maltooligosaccharide transport system substrate-binding protein
MHTPTATSPATSTRPPPTPTATPLSVRLVLWENLPPAQASALSDDVAAFQGQHPGVALDRQHYGDTPALLKQLSASGPAGFDLVLGDAALVSALQAGDMAQPLDEQLPADALQNLVAPARTGASRDGHLWGLADTVGLHLLLFYDRDLIAVPPADTDELMRVAQSFTHRGQWGLALNSYDPLWVVPWLAPHGGWLSDDQGNATLDTPAMVSALTLYLRWHGNLAGVAPLATYSEARQLFLDGKAAMLVDGDWAIGELSQAGRVSWGVAPLPLLSDTGLPAAPLVVGRYWVTRRSLPPDARRAATDFLTFVFAPARQLAWTERFGLLPTNQQALEDPRILSDAWLRASAQGMQAGRGLPLGLDADRLLDAMRAPLRAMLNGDLSPDDAARQMQEGVGNQQSAVGSQE